MRSGFGHKLVTAATVFCLLGGIVSTNMGWPWVVTLLFWGGGIAGMLWTTLKAKLPNHSGQDVSASFSQPGLIEGSRYGANNHAPDHGGDFSGGVGGGE